MRASNKAYILAVFIGLLAGGARAQTSVNKPVILQQLTKTSLSRLQPTAKQLSGSYRKTTAQLELDLIVFRWISHSLKMPKDIKNADVIISTLQKSLNDPIIDYAAEVFCVDSRARTSLRPSAESALIASLEQLKSQVEDGLASRESSPARSVDYFVATAKLCQTASLDISEAAISKELGDIHHYDMSRYRQAESFYDRAATTFQAYRCPASGATVYDGWGMLSMSVGKYTDSAERYIQAARQWENLIKEDPSQFRNRDKAGLAYISAGKAKEADGDYPGALEMMRSHGLFQLRNYAYATKSYELLVKNLITFSVFVRERMGESNDAIALLNEARGAASLQGDHLLLARVYEELAKVYASIGSPNAAAASTKRTASLWSAASEGDAALAQALRQSNMSRKDLTLLLSKAERAAIAFQELERAVKSKELWRKTADAYGASGLVDDQLRCLRSLAATLDTMKRPTEALECRSEAIAIARKTDRISLAADIVMSLIQSYRDQNDPQNALEGLNELVPLVTSTRNSRQAAEALEARGSLLVELSHPEEAIADFRSALEKFTTLVGDIWAAGRVSLELADAQTTAGQTSEARATLSDALSLIESSYGLENYRSSGYPEHTRVVTDLYRELIENQIRGDDVTGALGVVRRAQRYPWFTDLVRELRTNSDPAVSKFAGSNDMFTDDPDVTDIRDIDKVLAKDAAGYVTTCLTLERNYAAGYAALPVDPLAIYRVRASIPADTVVITYLPTSSNVFAFLCARDRCSIWQLDRGTVSESLSKLRRTLGYREQEVNAGVPVPPMTDWQGPVFLEIKEPLTELNERLIAPITDSLKASARLVFALPREFEALPLAAIVTGESSGAPVFLVQEHQISYLGDGMLDDLASADSREIYPSLDSLAIFADPENNLPGARKEATAIKNAYTNSRWYVGRERATATSFLSEFTRAGIVHIAAHHRLSANSFGFEIMLAPDSGSDGTIGLERLASMRSDSLELVVLSACDTVGSSDPVSTGPTRAAELFSLAGAKSVLGSFWKVSDDAASEVFSEFYKNLSKGKSRSESLRLAQLFVIESKRFAHPFYWACFALYGNPR